MSSKLDDTIEKLKSLPEDKQQYVALVIEDLSKDEVFEIPEHMLPAILDGLKQAENGEFATQEQVDALLRKPWA